MNFIGICYHCKNQFADRYEIDTAMCGHRFHTRCWDGICTPCSNAKALKDKHIQEDNWRAVTSTAIIACALLIIFKIKS